VSDHALRTAEREASAHASPDAVARLELERARSGLCPNGSPVIDTAEDCQCAPCLASRLCEAIFSCAKGTYQVELLKGHHAWSGADLRGTARKYGARYAASRAALVDRVNAALGIELMADVTFLFGTLIDRTRNGQRRAYLMVGEETLDWNDASEDDIRDAIRRAREAS
jgi:hypothetical protein